MDSPRVWQRYMSARPCSANRKDQNSDGAARQIQHMSASDKCVFKSS